MDEKLKRSLEENGYFELREVDGVVCGLYIYFATVGIVYGLDEVGYSRRYCYKDFGDASAALRDMVDPHVHATGPWIKCKGKFQGEPIDLLNPDLDSFD